MENDIRVEVDFEFSDLWHIQWTMRTYRIELEEKLLKFEKMFVEDYNIFMVDTARDDLEKVKRLIAVLDDKDKQKVCITDWEPSLDQSPHPNETA
mgnify:CR=1 FL=1